MADRQLSMFDGLEYVDDAERPAGEKSCRTCVHSSILRQPKTVPGFPGARLRRKKPGELGLRGLKSVH